MSMPTTSGICIMEGLESLSNSSIKVYKIWVDDAPLLFEEMSFKSCVSFIPPDWRRIESAREEGMSPKLFDDLPLRGVFWPFDRGREMHFSMPCKDLPLLMQSPVRLQFLYFLLLGYCVLETRRVHGHKSLSLQQMYVP